MTVAELSMLLSRLPPTCATWPVTIDIQGVERPAVGLAMLPQHYAHHDYPEGCVMIAAFLTEKPPAREIHIYRPPVGPVTG